MQRCRCDHLQLSPPSILINWDVTFEECANVVGESLPTLDTTKGPDIVAVLKEPMGSQGKGIYFVRNVDDIHKVISEQKQRALDEPNFLDFLIEAKGRIPSWGTNAHTVHMVFNVSAASPFFCFLTLLYLFGLPTPQYFKPRLSLPC